MVTEVGCGVETVKGAEEHPGIIFLTLYYHFNPVLQVLKDGGIIFSFSSQLITLL